MQFATSSTSSFAVPDFIVVLFFGMTIMLGFHVAILGKYLYDRFILKKTKPAKLTPAHVDKAIEDKLEEKKTIWEKICDRLSSIEERLSGSPSDPGNGGAKKTR